MSLSLNSNNSEKKPSKKLYNGIDEETLKLICNPALGAFNNALDDMKKNPSLEILSEIHMAILIDFSQTNNQILAKIPELLQFIENKEFYHEMCLILSDISHFNPLVVDILLEERIFDKLDYSEDITYEAVFNICDQNEKAIKEYKTGKYKLNEKISKLID